MTTWQEIETFKAHNPLYTPRAIAAALRVEPEYIRATARRRGWTFPAGPAGRPHKVALRKDIPIGQVYARAGEGTYCAGGHLLGRFNADVMVGQSQDGQLIPIKGMAYGLIHCPFCYAPTNFSGGYYFAVTP